MICARTNCHQYNCRGYAFDKPLLSPYELEVAMKNTEWREVYPMDYYSKGSGSWTNYYEPADGATPIAAAAVSKSA